MRIRISSQNICYWLIGFSLFAASIVAVPVLGFQLTPYRLGIPILYFWVLLNPQKRRIFQPTVFFMLFWALYAAISIIWCKDTGAWGKATYFIITGYMVTRVFTSVFSTPKQIVTCCKAFSVGLMVHNIIGWYEIITLDYRWVNEEYYQRIVYNGYKIPISVFFNPNDYATVLLFGVFALFVALAYTNKKLSKGAILIILCSSVVQLVLTQSRANLLGLILGICIVFLIKKKKPIRILVALCFVFLIITFLPVGDYLTKFFNTYLDFNFHAAANSEGQRLHLWKSAMSIFFKTFGFGAGAGNIAYRIAHDNTYSLTAGSVHNWWIELLSTYGIIIFALYCKFYFSMVKTFYHKTKTCQEYSALYLYMLGFMIAFIIGSISSSSMVTSEPIWCVWAILLSLYSISRHNCTQEKKQEITLALPA